MMPLSPYLYQTYETTKVTFLMQTQEILSPILQVKETSREALVQFSCLTYV
jgi:hypothetical protein